MGSLYRCDNEVEGRFQQLAVGPITQIYAGMILPVPRENGEAQGSEPGYMVVLGNLVLSSEDARNLWPHLFEEAQIAQT